MGDSHLIGKVQIYLFIGRKKENDNARKWKKQDILSKDVIQKGECFLLGLTNDADHWKKIFQLWENNWY